MEKSQAIMALAALAQHTRLGIFRLLVQAGAEGLPVGQIGDRLGLPSATLSFHLNQLKQAGLASCRRNGRSIIYTARYPSVNALLGFLTENCCGGEPGDCGLGTHSPRKTSAPKEGTSTVSEPSQTADVIIYHNPKCGTSRNALGLIRNAGIEPHVIEYLKTPPSRTMLVALIERMGVPVRSVIREKGSPYHDLGLNNPDLNEDQLIDAMIEHPILINRPIVVTPLRTKLCRPSEAVLDILPAPQRSDFPKDGAVISTTGEPVGEKATR